MQMSGFSPIEMSGPRHRGCWGGRHGRCGMPDDVPQGARADPPGPCRSGRGHINTDLGGTNVMRATQCAPSTCSVPPRPVQQHEDVRVCRLGWPDRRNLLPCRNASRRSASHHRLRARADRHADRRPAPPVNSSSRSRNGRRFTHGVRAFLPGGRFAAAARSCARWVPGRAPARGLLLLRLVSPRRCRSSRRSSTTRRARTTACRSWSCTAHLALRSTDSCSRE
jgi:hypothetical protein